MNLAKAGAKAIRCLGIVGTAGWFFFPFAASAQTLVWTAAQGEWFEPANWSPAQVPTPADDVQINNGGICEVVTPAATFARSLDVGVDGGTGTLRFVSEGFDDDLFLEGGANIGVTETGTVTSTGTVEVAASARSFSFVSTGAAPFRLGVTETGGAAHGTLTITDRSSTRTFETDSFSTIRIGVSEGAGSAAGRLEAPGLEIRDHPSVEVGVSTQSGEATGHLEIEELEDLGSLIVGKSHAGGNATGTLINGRFGGVWSHIEVGVASSDGGATGVLESEQASLRGDSAGNLEVGIAEGSGRAEGSLLLPVLGVNSQTQIRDFVDVRVGIAAGDGEAIGTVRAGSSLRAETLEVGTRTGAAMGTGTVRFERGLAQLDQLTLGEGSTLLLGLKNPARGVSFPVPGYAAIDADAVTIEPGAELVAGFAFVPPAPQTFELINSATATGISGEFTTVDIENLNQGYTATPAVVVDGGVEKLVLELTGTPVAPEWTHPQVGDAAGDWFDPAHWSSPLVPGSGDPVTVNNGGEARADGSSAPGPIEVFSLAVGEDGGAGSLSVDGLGIEPSHGVSIGRIGPDHIGGGTATGVATLTDVTFAPRQIVDTAPAEDPEMIFAGLRVGVAAGEGTADGTLVFEGGTIFMPPENERQRQASQVRIGTAYLVTDGTSSTAMGRLEVNPGGGTSTFEVDGFFVGRAETLDAVTSGSVTAVAEASVSNLSLRGLAGLASSFCSGDNNVVTASVPRITWENVSVVGERNFNMARVSNGGSGCSGTASAPSVDFRNSVFQASLNFGTIETGGDSLTHSESALTATLTDVLIEPLTSLDLSFGTLSASSGSASLDIDVTMHRVDIRLAPDDSDFTLDQEGRDLRLARAQVSGAVTSVLEVDIDASESHLQVDEIQLSNAEFFESGNSATLDLAMALRDGSTITASHLCVGCVVSDDDAAVDMTASFELTDSTVTLGAEAVVGELAGGSTAAGNRMTAALRLHGSSLVAAEVTIGATHPPNHPMDADLVLQSSWMDTELLTLGADGDLTMHLEGTDRATAGTVGVAGTYAAIDAADALLEGEVVAQFDFLPAPGTHTFDLLITDSPTALDDITATLSVLGLDPGFTVDFFGVAEDGVDVLRLTISGSPTADLAIDITDSPDPVSVDDPLTYTLAVTNMGPNPATAVSVVDTLPPTATFQSASGPGWTCGEAAGTVTCTRPTLAVGAAPPIAIQVIAPSLPGTVDDSASVSAAVTDLAAANNSRTESTTVISASDVSGTKEVTGNLAPGGVATYTIVLLNSADSPQVDDPLHPEFTDTLPSELTLLTADADHGTVTVTGNAVRWDGAIPAGDSVVLTLDARIDTGADGEVVVNQGEIFYDADGDGTNETVRVTDDPELPAGDDATVFIVGSVAEIPAAQSLGLALLALLLAVAAIATLRRRQSPA